MSKFITVTLPSRRFDDGYRTMDGKKINCRTYSKSVESPFDLHEDELRYILKSNGLLVERLDQLREYLDNITKVVDYE